MIIFKLHIRIFISFFNQEKTHCAVLNFKIRRKSESDMGYLEP